MKRFGSFLLAALLSLSLLFLLSVLVYIGFGRVTGSSLKEQEKAAMDLEKQAQEQTQAAEHWQAAEKEYIAFREKYLVSLEQFAEFRRSMDDMIRRNGLASSGFRYANRNSPDGKLTFVRFSFSVSGSYEQARRLVWELERLPHAARIGSLSMQQDEGRIQCGLELEVVFEK